MYREETFHAMGTTAHVIVAGTPAHLALARSRIDELERLWSRFLPDSEISMLNAAEGAPVRVSPVTFELINRAVEGANATGMRFDPLVLPAVVGAGYDRSFEDVTTAPGPARRIPTHPGAITLDHIVRTVRLHEGAGFDPGGIGKGYGADLVAEELIAAGATRALVNIGGDLRVSGEAPESGWHVDIDDPASAHRLGSLTIRDGAVATSSTMKRSWIREGQRLHHLIDPATMRPAETQVASVTIISTEAWWAEVWAKAAVLSGPKQFAQVCATAGVTGLLVNRDGSSVCGPGLEKLAS